MERNFFELIEYLNEKKSAGSRYVAFNIDQEISRDNIFIFESSFDAAEFCYENTTDMDVYNSTSIDVLIFNLETKAQQGHTERHNEVSNQDDGEMPELTKSLISKQQDDESGVPQRKLGI